MDRRKFDAIFPIICAAITKKIIIHYQLAEDEAILILRESELYAMLEEEETKVWQYSNEKLFYLYKDEIRNGKLVLPNY